MNARKIALVCLVSALAAAAQTAPPSQKVAPAAKHPAASPMKPKAAAKHPATSPMKPKVAAQHPAASPMTPKVAAKRRAPAQKKAAPANAAEASTATAAAAAVKTAGRRDPFMSPVREGGPTGPTCSVGKKCLAVDSIVLKGIVEAQSGAIALVENTRNMVYFLRENDPVFNGYVVKITPDSITFRENVVDRLGKESTRDVVKKVSAPAV